MDASRIPTCNLVLACFAKETWLSADRGRVRVHWETFSGGSLSRPWQTRGGQDFYPVWFSKWAHGGTASTALSQLVRWVQERPVLPLSTWRHWTSPTMLLGRDHGPKMVKLLEDAGYPDVAMCVLCGEPIVAGLDWWHLNGVSGPCCDAWSGCKQGVRPKSQVQSSAQ